MKKWITYLQGADFCIDLDLFDDFQEAFTYVREVYDSGVYDEVLCFGVRREDLTAPEPAERDRILVESF